MNASAPLQLLGLAASPGIALGRAVIIQRGPDVVTAGPAGTPKEEDARLTKALFQAALDLRILRNQTRERLGTAKAEIFDVHLSFLSDPEFIGQARTRIAKSGLSASAALREASQVFLDILESSGDDTLISRATDLRDVSHRLQLLLSGSASAVRQFDSDVIVIAHDLAPSDTAQLDLAHVRGFVTAAGSLNSHSSILARALRLPALAGLTDALTVIPEGATVIIDGAAGTLTLHPDPEQVAEARRRQTAQLAEEAQLVSFAKLPSRTADGRALALAANIGRLEEMPGALAQGAEGIGLYRSEFSYLDRPALPTEDELYHLYRQSLEQMAPHPVIIRTLDIGGDKQVPGLSLPREENPFLGVRGLRLCLAQEELFRTQLRALLRASSHGHLKIMLPMVAVAAEVRQARRWFAEERARVEAAGYQVAPDIQLGIMIEIPAAALMADRLAREVDFFSIGTNDLVQYTMAADRMNARLAHLQAAHHPAILQLIKLTVEAAHRHGKWVGLCGEMGSDPLALRLLDGLGLDEISLHSAAIVRTRAALSRMDHAANVHLAAHCLTLGSAEEVAAVVTAAT
jgi:phosphotransferase system enzyme I (PtsI)